MDAFHGKIRRLPEKASRYHLDERIVCKMAKCAHCGKTTTFGHSVSFSNRKSNRPFLPNLQRVTVIENGRKVKKTLCTKCIRTLVKTA
jgi:large subunit ribosomal protein L28